MHKVEGTRHIWLQEYGNSDEKSPWDTSAAFDTTGV